MQTAVILALMCGVCSLMQASETVGPHRFVQDRVDVYVYTLRQEVTLVTAGDKMTFSTLLNFEYALRPRQVTDQRVELEVRLQRIKGAHCGPGSKHVIDTKGESTEARGEQDPLLGNLFSLIDIPLILVVDPASGRVVEVRGTEALAQALRTRLGENAEALEGAIQGSWTADHIGRLWTRLLAVPGTAKETIDLRPALPASVERTWEGTTWKDQLAPGEPPILNLHSRPTPVSLTLIKAEGTGRSQWRQGVLEVINGDLEATWRGTALSQPVEQLQRIRWSFTRLAGP